MKNRPDDEKHFTLHNHLYVVDYEMVIGMKSLFDTSHTLHMYNLLYYRYIQAFVKCEVFYYRLCVFYAAIALSLYTMPSLQHRHTLVAVKRIHAQPVSHCRADPGTEPCQLLRECHPLRPLRPPLHGDGRGVSQRSAMKNVRWYHQNVDISSPPRDLSYMSAASLSLSRI